MGMQSFRHREDKAVFTPKEIKQWSDSVESKKELIIENKGRVKEWIPARPVFIYYFPQRIKAAWKVLTGKWDALDWEN